MKKWQRLSSKLAFDNPWFKVRQDTVQLPNGKVLNDYFLWQDNDVAQIIAVTEDHKLLLERQYKHAVGDFMIEFPAGYLDENEHPLEAARREFMEETGYFSDTISKLGTFSHNPTKELGKVHVFLAENVYKKQEPNFDVTEEIELLFLSFSEVFEMIRNGEIWGTGTVAASFLFFQKVGFIKPS